MNEMLVLNALWRLKINLCFYLFTNCLQNNNEKLKSSSNKPQRSVRVEWLICWTVDELPLYNELITQLLLLRSYTILKNEQNKGE